MKFTSTILPLAFCLLAVHINLSHQKSRSFGESCSSSERCDPQSGTVACNTESQKCDCKDVATMVYDETLGECVSVEGASCFMRRLRNRNVRNCLAGTICVPLSSKSLFGTCVLSQVYKMDDEQVFAESSTTEEAVETTETTQTSEIETTQTTEIETTQTTESSPTSESTPVSGSESTPVSGSESTPVSGTESTPVSGSESTPVSGSESTPVSGTESTPVSGTESTPVSGTESTTSEPEDPKQGHDGPCADTTECIAYAECEAGKCKCGGDFLPQEEKQKCARKVDVTCSANEECVANAHCMDGETKKCMCNDGYDTKDGACAAKSIDGECDADSVCLVENSVCSVSGDFTNGTCQCKDDLKPSEKKDKCNSAFMNAINFSLFIVLVSSSYFFNKFNH